MPSFTHSNVGLQRPSSICKNLNLDQLAAVASFIRPRQRASSSGRPSSPNRSAASLKAARARSSLPWALRCTPRASHRAATQGPPLHMPARRSASSSRRPTCSSSPASASAIAAAARNPIEQGWQLLPPASARSPSRIASAALSGVDAVCTARPFRRMRRCGFSQLVWATRSARWTMRPARHF